MHMTIRTLPGPIGDIEFIRARLQEAMLGYEDRIKNVDFSLWAVWDEDLARFHCRIVTTAAWWGPFSVERHGRNSYLVVEEAMEKLEELLLEFVSDLPRGEDSAA